MATFNHWLTVAANSSTQSATGASTHQPVPVPPDYTACITSLQTQLAAVLKGRKQPTDRAAEGPVRSRSTRATCSR